MKALIFLGAGDLAREIFAASLDPVPSQGPYKPLAFVDDNPKLVGTTLQELPVWSWEDLERLAPSDACFVCAVGSPAARASMLDTLRQQHPGADFASIVHKSAVLMPKSQLGPGCYVAANATIAIGACLGEHVVVNQNTSIGHDVEIGNYTVVSPGCVLSGRTQVGEQSFLGSGAITYPGVKIGRGCTVSAQAVIARRLRDGQKAIAKPNLMIL